MPRSTRWLSHPRVIAAAATAAIALCLPALAVGWLMDDYAHRVTMLRVAGVPVEPLSVFANFTGDVRRSTGSSWTKGSFRGGPCRTTASPSRAC